MNWSKIIIYALIILALIGVLGFIIYFTGGFTTDFTGFYVTVDGEDVLSTGSDFRVKEDDPLKVEVKYVFASPNDEAKGYTVKVVPNAIEGTSRSFRPKSTSKTSSGRTSITPCSIISRTWAFAISPRRPA